MHSLIKAFSDKHMLHQTSVDHDALVSDKPLVAYVGFDATAKSLHIGNLVSILMLRKMQQLGHTPIVLMGGATTMIGDPSGKNSARKMMEKSEINENVENIFPIFERLLNFNADIPNSAKLVNNIEWFENINFIDFIRDIGSHFSINRMMSFDSVKSRMVDGNSLSFLEFNYMIMQAYDFLQLHNRFGCSVQMGGSDQWGNIVNGIDLVRKVTGQRVHGITAPLITMSNGAKMGKSENGAIWLNDDMLSSFDFWQFWRNVPDEDVFRFLKIFTDLSIDELDDMEHMHINECKIILADNMTELCRGTDAAADAKTTALAAFGNGNIDNLPSITVTGQSIDIVTAIIDFGFADSKSNARRLIVSNSVKIDDKIIADSSLVLSLLNNKSFKLSVGKKKHGIIKG